MKAFIKLCCSIVRRNKGFSAGIFIMSLLCGAVSFLGANFGPSSSDTILNFLSESQTPEAVFMTDILPEDTKAQIEAISGVHSVFPGFLYDTNMETADGDLYSIRIFRQDPHLPFVHTVHEGPAAENHRPSAAISYEFAGHNHLHPGDTLRLNTPLGEKQVTIDRVVSNPDTLSCVRDEMSAYESYQFGYLYMKEADFNTLIPAEGQANQWLIYFDSNLDTESRKGCMTSIREVLNGHVLTESLTEDSEALDVIQDDLNTISVLCSFVPGIIWLISLGFNFIFIRIIVENQRRTIGMLRAIGYSIRRVILIFITYTVLINIPALLCGIFAGYQLLCTCLGLIASADGILDLVVTIRPGLTSAMLLMVFAASILAALLSAGTISRIDPSQAYGSMEISAFEPPAFLSRLHTDAFFKISLVSLIRNYKRQIVGAFCIAACIISMCIGFEGVLTIGHPIDAVYGGRFRYDLTARGIDSETIEEMRRSLKGVAVFEPVTFFSSELLGEKVKIATLREGDTLTVVEDADGRRLYPGDGLILDEMFAKINDISTGDRVKLGDCSLTVTGIAREIVYPVLYISPETARKMGHKDPDCIFLSLEDGADITEVKKQISAIAKDAYLVELSTQHDDIQSGFMAMRTIMFVFALLAFGIGSLLILNITVIDYNENRCRYAALRALGTPVKRLGKVALVQNLFRVTLGILIACPLSHVCVTVLLDLLSGASQQYVPVRYGSCLLLSCVIPLLYVLFGTVFSMRKIRKMDFCSVMNETE